MSYPSALLREYHILSDDHGAAGDTAYSLAFTTKGQIVVRITRHHQERFKAPEVHDVSADEFGTRTVNGKTLLSLVVAKLCEILPDQRASA